MRESIISITIVALIASVADMLAPAEWKKYIRVLLGFLILFTVISPLANLKGIKIPLIEDTSKQNDVILSENIHTSLKENIEKDIENRIKTEFDIALKAEVTIDTDEENKITGVKKIVLTTKNGSERITKRLTEVYGCENIEYK